MYQSKYYTCEEIDERLLKGYYDDAVSSGYPGTFDQFKLALASQDAVNLDILNNHIGYTSTEAISKINELYPNISHPLTFTFFDNTYNRDRRFKCVISSSSRSGYIDASDYTFTLEELNSAEGATDIKELLYEIGDIGFSGSAAVIDGNTGYYCGQLIIFGDNMGHVVNQILVTNNTLSDDGLTITSSQHTRTFQYERFLSVSGSLVDREGNIVRPMANSKWYYLDYELQNDLNSSVKVTEQSLTEEQKKQACANIGVIKIDTTKTKSQVLTMIENGEIDSETLYIITE